MRKILKKIFVFLLFLFVLGFTICLVKYLSDRRSYVTLALNYSEGTKSLKNPERGWYLINACMVNDDYKQADSFYETLKKQNQEGDTLSLVLFNLSAYRTTAISENGLKYTARMLENVKKAGMKAIVRFVYDWDGKGEQLEPDQLEIVQRHMEQLGPVLNRYKNNIYLLQGIFVGSYGEMNGSKYLSNENVEALLNKLLGVTDDTLLLSVRTPTYWRTFARSSNPVNSFTSLPYARIGLYNDGLCSSVTDLGTYSDSGTEGEYSDKWERQAEINFQSKLCLFVPNGGEMAALSEFNDLDKVAGTFPDMHISYLNRGYNTEILNKWRGTVYHQKSKKSPYEGLDGYKYIEDHLGYRFVLKEVTIPKKAYINEKIAVHVKIENTGFAGLYLDKKLELIFRGSNTGNTLVFPINEDIRNWRPGEESGFTVLISPAQFKEDVYDMFLKISDQDGSSISLANDGIYRDIMQANAIGSIKVQRFTLKKLWDME